MEKSTQVLQVLGMSVAFIYYHNLELTFIQCATHPKNVSSFELWIHARGVHQGPNTLTWHGQLSNNWQILVTVHLQSNSDQQQSPTGGKHFDKRLNKHQENETVELGPKNSGVLKL